MPAGGSKKTEASAAVTAADVLGAVVDAQREADALTSASTPAAPEVPAAAPAAAEVAPAPAELPRAPRVPPVDPMAGVIARLIATYPARAEEIAKGVTVHGDPVVTRVPVKVPGGWEQKVVSTHQKYRLADGTILPLET